MTVYIALAVTEWRRGSSPLAGDGYYYASIAISLWQDGDLDIADELPGEAWQHSGHVALDQRGRLVPKHSLVLPLLALPVLAVSFDPVGCAVANLLAFSLLLVSLWVLAKRAAGDWAGAAATALTGLATFLPRYSWSFGSDVLGTALLLAGVATLPRRGGPDFGWRALLAGLLVGTAVVARLLLVVTLPGLALLLAGRQRQVFAGFVVGFALPLACFGALNFHLFGSPGVTGYDRIAVVGPEGWTTESHRKDFSEPLGIGLVRQVTDRRIGLLATSPITVISLVGLPLLWRQHRDLALWCGWTALSLLVVVAQYRYWHVSGIGNRFLMPLVVLGGVPLAAMVARGWALSRRRRLLSDG